MTPHVTATVDLDTLTVEDIMVKQVITVAADASVSDLVRLLDYEQVSGVPVIDSHERLAGVVSATDVLRLVAHTSEIEAGGGQDIDADEMADAPEQDAYHFFIDPTDRLTLGFRADEIGDDALGDYRVSDIMTPATFTVRANASVRELAQFLTRGRIHRALVVDAGLLRGIITTSDVVRAVAGDVTDLGGHTG